MTKLQDRPALETFLERCGLGVPSEAAAFTDDTLWHDYVGILGPLWETHPDLLHTAEWSIPYATQIGNVLQRMMRLADVHGLLNAVTPRNVLVPLLAPPGDVRELQQTQYRLPLTHTFEALKAVDGLSILEIAGYLPPDEPRSRTLWFVICGMADWHRPEVTGAEPRAATTWREPALLLEYELELPYFAELSFPGSRRATLADEYRASLLSGRLRPTDETHWVADWLRSGQYVVEPHVFEAFLRGIVKDWWSWRSSRRPSVMARLRRLREHLPSFF